VSGLGDAVAITRRAKGLTQLELGDVVGVSQVAINRYESGEREPDEKTLTALAAALGVTPRLLRHGDKFRGALAVDAHMRRQKTTKASAWRQLEARLNKLRIHSSFLFEEVSLRSDQIVPTFDAEFVLAEDAARMVRSQWRMPIGPVVNLVSWLESAGCIVFEEDFGTHRIDGLSQWIGDHPIVLVNVVAPVDRKRLTLAHELGHLVLHSGAPTDDMENQANAFAAEFLMPTAAIRSDLRKVDLGSLLELKREWGVSMQALFERAYRFGYVDAASRRSFYMAMNARGWKTVEPGAEFLAVEHPELAQHIGRALEQRGLSADQIADLAGFTAVVDNPFRTVVSNLRSV
jgi:Zn-dependent peptidase ImmA (M78 family)/DNA-binding XRE family transcriptional regulator